MPLKRLRTAIGSHPLVRTLTGLRGNERACVYTEPLWGIPNSLYTPFFTVYMYALGVSDRQIGILLSLGLLCQVLAAFFGGILTDRLGRRLTTFVFDFLAWSLPVLLWALARNFWWFLAAAVCNSVWQITSISWNCLMVEDCDKGKLVHIYTWCTISGLLAALFAPLSGLLVARLGMVPAVRILMLITFVMMTTKFILLYIFTTETRQGIVRMAETRNLPTSRMISEYLPLVRSILHTPETLMILAILVILNITGTVTSSFFALYTTQNLGIPESWLAYFPIGRAAVMMVFIFTVQTLLTRHHFRIPMLSGLVLYMGSQLLLIQAPAGNLGFLVCYVLCEAFAYALVMPQKDSLLVLLVDPGERARIVSLLYMVMIGLTSPFGWIAGELSQHDRRWPFLLNMALYAACFLLILLVRFKPAASAAARPE